MPHGILFAEEALEQSLESSKQMLISKISKLIYIIAVVCAFAICSNAKATLIGDTISANGMGLSPSTATIGGGVEFTGISNYLSFDFGASTLTITTSGVGWANWGDYVFSGFSSTITGVSIESNDGFSGYLLNPIAFTQDSFTLDMNFGNAVNFDNNYQFVNAVLVFNIETASPTVPDSGRTLSLLALLTIGLVALRRKFGHA